MALELFTVHDLHVAASALEHPGRLQSSSNECYCRTTHAKKVPHGRLRQKNFSAATAILDFEQITTNPRLYRVRCIAEGRLLRVRQHGSIETRRK